MQCVLYTLDGSTNAIIRHAVHQTTESPSSLPMYSERGLSSIQEFRVNVDYTSRVC